MMDLPDHDSGAGIAGLQGLIGQLAKRDRLRLRASNQTRQIVMRNSPLTMTATAGAA